MTLRLQFLLLALPFLAAAASAADGSDQKAAPQQDAPRPAPPTDKSAPPSQSNPPPAKDASAKADAPTVLPPVEVKRNRLIEHDRQILDLQEEIEREKKKTKPTESDKALNNEKVSSALSIFGGSSSEARAEVARERLSLMETELGLLEMMDRVKTKAERDDLQKQANEIRDMRRNLERGGLQSPKDR
ncbi:MAG TPA: hypothetical protein VG838_08070 [Opitutaceae bacterium]|nr:hypothetical protein [Opitutaceae bacterium]